MDMAVIKGNAPSLNDWSEDADNDECVSPIPSSSVASQVQSL